MVDADLITRAIGGDQAAQRALYEAHYGAAFRLCHLLLQDACDAEEVVQDAFVYLFRNLERYDPGKGAFWTWLRVMLVSRCRNKRRRRQLPVVSLENLESTGRTLADHSGTGDPARALDVQNARRRMWEALQQVSPGARDALILRYYEGLPYIEIGAALGCSSDAARSRVVHGKVQLRRLLAGLKENFARGKGLRHTPETG